ncbi:fructose-bisphosphate aldolase class-I domain-containing protein [Ditylenchus destructor]|uniref:Fructose-bisphosphate aldolase n=1 Tax=Ditylenchus destructor TaxID=166010 RepID=A0AAD4MXE8_9BILA|nr:fructose-bisphosphate aldolase class-I domain-containing protein [Ditylenchus destructor]
MVTSPSPTPVNDENEVVLSARQELELRDTVEKMLQPGKGILAADDTNEGMGSKLKSCNLENTPDNRRRYRQLLFTTPNISKHISGVILYHETYTQASEKGERLVDLLRRQNVTVGIQVDLGLVPLTGSPKEFTAQGMDNLAQRAAEYKKGGCNFAKWRVPYQISNSTPSHLALQENANLSARYASICQKEGLVPIVEPDVSCEGEHSLERCQEVTEQVLAYTYKALADHGVFLEGTVLKTNMCIPGFSAKKQATPEQVAQATITCLSRTVPPAVPGVAFLSGGITELDATKYLDAINKAAKAKWPAGNPWRLTFCYGRALQATVIKTWQGCGDNVSAAQKAFLHRARANAEAEKGEYESEKAVTLALESMVLGNPNLRMRYY